MSDCKITKEIVNALDGDEISLIKVDEVNKCVVIANQYKVYLFDYECNRLTQKPK